MHGVEAAAVHAFEQDQMAAGIGDGEGDRDPGLIGLATAVAIIFLAPSMVRRLPVVMNTFLPRFVCADDTGL